MGKRRDWSRIGEVVEKIRELGLTYKEGAERFGVKVGDLYCYNQRMKRRGAEGNGKGRRQRRPLGKRASRAKRSVGPVARRGQGVDPVLPTGRTDPRLQTDRGPAEAEVPGGRQSQADPPGVERGGAAGECDSSFDKEPAPAKGSRRFEAQYPGELWQMDVTYVYIRKIPVLYLVVIVDDYSRFCVAAELCRDQRADTLIGVLHNACTAYGVPKKLLTDQGSGFYSWSREQTQFQEYLDDQRIEHIVAEPHSPQSQGKVERLIQTDPRGAADAGEVQPASPTRRHRSLSFIQSYNFDRPHQGIQGKRPTDRFHGVVGDVEQAQAELAGRDVDLSRGYVVYQVQGRRVCVVCTRGGPAGLSRWHAAEGGER